MGDITEAADAARRTLELDPSFSYANMYLGEAMMFANQPDSAGAAFERLFQADSMAPSARAFRVVEFALAGKWPEAQHEAALVDQTITGGSRDVDLAIAQVALGNKGAALDALQRAVDKHSFYIAAGPLECDPIFSPLKGDPRFTAMVKQAGQGMCPGTPRWPIPARPGANR